MPRNRFGEETRHGVEWPHYQLAYTLMNSFENALKRLRKTATYNQKSRREQKVLRRELFEKQIYNFVVRVLTRKVLDYSRERLRPTAALTAKMSNYIIKRMLHDMVNEEVAPAEFFDPLAYDDYNIVYHIAGARISLSGNGQIMIDRPGGEGIPFIEVLADGRRVKENDRLFKKCFKRNGSRT